MAAPPQGWGGFLRALCAPWVQRATPGYAAAMNDLAVYLARHAAELRLDAQQVGHADPAALQAFVQTVLDELVALGLLPGHETPGCWATPRPAGH